VAAGHREAAFSGSQWLIQELKQKVPIWKRPMFKDKKFASDKKKLKKAVPA
jgi:molybdopterin synthase catalytic subunit